MSAEKTASSLMQIVDANGPPHPHTHTYIHTYPLRHTDLSHWRSYMGL